MNNNKTSNALEEQRLIRKLCEIRPSLRDAIAKVYQRDLKQRVDVPSKQDLNLFGKLRRITPELAEEIPLEKALMTMNDVPLMTRHSLIGMNGDINAGKTPIALLIACMAIDPSCASDEPIMGGLEMENIPGNIIYFDTELETDMLCHYVQHSWTTRLNNNQHHIERLHYYPLRHIPTDQRMRAIEMLIDNIGNVGFVVVDSLTQMVADKMDFKEATKNVDRIFTMIDEHRCPFLCTIHGNRGDETGKATGHIGAVLQERASSYLRLMYDTNDVSGDSRILTADFPQGKVRWGKKKNAYTAFKWDEGRKGFVKIEYEPKSEKPDVKTETEQLVCDLYRSNPQDYYTFSDIIIYFQKAGGLAESTAKKRVRDCCSWGILFQEHRGMYRVR